MKNSNCYTIIAFQNLPFISSKRRPNNETRFSTRFACSLANASPIFYLHFLSSRQPSARRIDQLCREILKPIVKSMFVWSAEITAFSVVDLIFWDVTRNHRLQLIFRITNCKHLYHFQNRRWIITFILQLKQFCNGYSQQCRLFM